MLIFSTFLACSTDTATIEKCSAVPLADQADLLRALDDEQEHPRTVGLDWNVYNEAGFAPVDLTLSPTGFTSDEAQSCGVGDEVWASSNVELAVESTGWFSPMTAEATLSVRGGATVIESIMLVPIDAYLPAVTELVEAEIEAEVAEEDMVTEASMEVLVDEHVGEVGAEVHIYEDALAPLLPECDTQECKDQHLQVDLAGTSHPA